jgi:hypothetical protein
VGITLVLARGKAGWVGVPVSFSLGGTTLDTHAIDDAARLPAWSFPGGELLLATRSPRQPKLPSLEDDDMGDGIATKRDKTMAASFLDKPRGQLS